MARSKTYDDVGSDMVDHTPDDQAPPADERLADLVRRNELDDLTDAERAEMNAMKNEHAERAARLQRLRVLRERRPLSDAEKDELHALALLESEAAGHVTPPAKS